MNGPTSRGWAARRGPRAGRRDRVPGGARATSARTGRSCRCRGPTTITDRSSRRDPAAPLRGHFHVRSDVVLADIGEQRPNAAALGSCRPRHEHEQDPETGLRSEATPNRCGGVATDRGGRLRPREDHHVGRGDGQNPARRDRVERRSEERCGRAVRVDVDVIERRPGRDDPTVRVDRDRSGVVLGVPDEDRESARRSPPSARTSRTRRTRRAGAARGLRSPR